jgi:hypothetical protein
MAPGSCFHKDGFCIYNEKLGGNVNTGTNFINLFLIVMFLGVLNKLECLTIVNSSTLY